MDRERLMQGVLSQNPRLLSCKKQKKKEREGIPCQIMKIGKKPQPWEERAPPAPAQPDYKYCNKRVPMRQNGM